MAPGSVSRGRSSEKQGMEDGSWELEVYLCIWFSMAFLCLFI